MLTLIFYFSTIVSSSFPQGRQIPTRGITLVVVFTALQSLQTGWFHVSWSLVLFSCCFFFLSFLSSSSLLLLDPTPSSRQLGVLIPSSLCLIKESCKHFIISALSQWRRQRVKEKYQEKLSQLSWQRIVCVCSCTCVPGTDCTCAGRQAFASS